MAKVLVVGLNPAWQTVMEFDSLNVGEVNRAQSSLSLASGKGMNTAKVLRRLGHEVYLTQFLGGDNGKRCLVACEALGIHTTATWVKAETRQCLTLLNRESGVATELIEPFTVSESGLEEKLLGELPEDPDFFTAIALCGTAPSGVSEQLYSRILKRFPSALTVVDAWQSLDDSVLKRATFLKINHTEFKALQAQMGASSPELKKALIAVTAGAEDAFLLQGADILAKFKIPTLAKVINPIGAGDTVTAGLLHYLVSGMESSGAFRMALAMGAASCLTRMPTEYFEVDFQRIVLAMGESHD